MWLDGGEYEALARASRASSEKNAVASYRSAPRLARTLATGRFACARCDADTDIAQSCVLPSGLVCTACYLAVEEEQQASPRDYGPLRDTMLRERFVRERRTEAGAFVVFAALRDFFVTFFPSTCPFCLRLHEGACPKA